MCYNVGSHATMGQTNACPPSQREKLKGRPSPGDHAQGHEVLQEWHPDGQAL